MTERPTTGGSIDSYCTKCRLNLEHVIVAMIGGNIIKVKCNTCGSMHKYREVGGSTTAKPARAAGARKTAQPVRTISAQAYWEAAMAEASGEEIHYDMLKSFTTGNIIVHTVFGKGVVQKTFHKKCSILFRDGEKLLASANS